MFYGIKDKPKFGQVVLFAILVFNIIFFLIAAMLIMLLAGKTGGVVVTAGDGMPGSASTIRIRGGASLNASNDPLIVIDGLPVSNDGISGMADPLSSINPEDIEQVTVLKNATAIYGAQGANGVVLITTKRGEEGKAKLAQAEPIYNAVIGPYNTAAKSWRPSEKKDLTLT